jgi:hypothetical protein
LPKGKSLGACSSVNDWAAAEAWARAFRSPRFARGAVEIEIDEQALNGRFGARAVRTLVQTERPRDGVDAVDRMFVFVETGSGFTGCKVTEELLQGGYVTGPKPVSGSLEAIDVLRFRLRAKTVWDSASAEKEEGEWLVICGLHQDELGCVSMPAWWDDHPHPDSDRRERLTALIEPAGAGYAWTHKDKRLEVPLLLGESNAVRNFELFKLSADGTVPED